MSGNQKPSLVLIYVKLPLVTNDRNLLAESVIGLALSQAELNYVGLGQLAGKEPDCKPHFIKLAEGVFLADEVKAHPWILQVVTYCNAQRLPLIIAPLADAPLGTSLDDPELTKWLGTAGVQSRKLKFQTRQ